MSISPKTENQLSSNMTIQEDVLKLRIENEQLKQELQRCKNMCGEVCTDNRFKVIDKVKNTLLEKTNIDKSPKELEVLDSILFRLWQCRFLDNVEVEE